MPERKILLAPTSRYRGTSLYSMDGQEIGKKGTSTFFGSFVAPKFSDEEDSYITVQEKDIGRLDLLAHRYYGDSALWWVIAVANDLLDVTYGPEPGTLLRIPKNPWENFNG